MRIRYRFAVPASITSIEYFNRMAKVALEDVWERRKLEIETVIKVTDTGCGIGQKKWLKLRRKEL